MAMTIGGPAEDLTRPSLLLRLRDSGDAEAWRLFLEAYTPLVYAYCRRRRLQPADIADVTQEVMAQVMRSIVAFSYQRDRGRFRDWLGTVTRTKLLRFLRADARAGKGSGAEVDELARQAADPGSDTLWNEQFQARVLEVALERTRTVFEEATWKAFERNWKDRRPAPEVAEELGVPVESIYVAKSRVLKRLRAEVDALTEDFPLLEGPKARSDAPGLVESPP